MRVEVVYCDRHTTFRRKLILDEGSTIEQAITASRLLLRFPQLNLRENKVGVFGQIKKPSDVSADGDRIEVYREIVCDPEQVPRKDRDDDDDD